MLALKDDGCRLLLSLKEPRLLRPVLQKRKRKKKEEEKDFFLLLFSNNQKIMMDHSSFLNLRRGTVPRCSEYCLGNCSFFSFFFLNILSLPKKTYIYIHDVLCKSLPVCLKDVIMMACLKSDTLCLLSTCSKALKVGVFAWGGLFSRLLG